MSIYNVYIRLRLAYFSFGRHILSIAMLQRQASHAFLPIFLQHIRANFRRTVALAGLLMIIFDERAGSGPAEPKNDTKACPACAETIEFAALKCKHCCGDVLPAMSAKAPLMSGWTIRPECAPWAHAEATRSLKRLGLPTTKGSAKYVAVGPFASEAEALGARDNIRSVSDLLGEIHIVAPDA